MAGEALPVRCFRCPNCRRVHTERSNVTVYNCAGCGKVLRAGSWPGKVEEGYPPEEEKQGNNGRSSDVLPLGRQPSSISDDGESSEGKFSAPPVASAGADTCSNDGSLTSCENLSGKRDKHNRLSRRTVKNKTDAFPGDAAAAAAGSSSRSSPLTDSVQSRSEDDRRSISLSSDSTSNDAGGAPVGRLENLRLEDYDPAASFAGGTAVGRPEDLRLQDRDSSFSFAAGWEGHRNLPVIRDINPPHLQPESRPNYSADTLRRRPSEDEAGSSWSDGSPPRQRLEKGQPAAPPETRRNYSAGTAGGRPLEDRAASSWRGWSYHRQGSEMRQPAAPPETRLNYSAAMARGWPLEDGAASSWRGGNHHRQGSEILEPAVPPETQRNYSAPPARRRPSEDGSASSWSGGSHHRLGSEIRQPPAPPGTWRSYSAVTEGQRPSEDEAASSRSGGSHHRQGSEIRQPPAPPKRRHCRAVAGAAPLVLCSGCEQLLLLPVDFLLFPGRRRLRCGSCSRVLAFWFAAGGRLRPEIPGESAAESILQEVNEGRIGGGSPMEREAELSDLPGQRMRGYNSPVRDEDAGLGGGRRGATGNDAAR